MSAAPIDLLDFARLEESRQAQSVARIADEFESISGGTMCFGGVGSWVNQAMGLGMDCPVAGEDVERLIAFYESRGVEPKVELCPFAHDSFVRGLSQRGFVIREFENVLALELRTASLPPMPDGVEVIVMDPSDQAQLATYMSITRAGFSPPDPDLFARLERRMLARAETRSFLAVIDGVPAAAGSCEVSAPCAGLFGLTTLERFRRRGCQRALMIARLRAAQQNGCRYASIHSRPDVATGRNALRLGFQVAFTKAIVARPGQGLSPSP
jgi:GNAT superfamily N-acetyltransferase